MSQAFADSNTASDELMALLDKTAAVINTLDDAPFPEESIVETFVPGNDWHWRDRLEARQALLRLQIYTGALEGAEKSLDALQKEVETLEEGVRQDRFRFFIVESLARLGRFKDAAEELTKITDPVTTIQATIQLADLFVSDIKASDEFDLLPIIQSMLAKPIVGERPDFETLLHALSGTILAKTDRDDEARQSFDKAYDALGRTLDVASQNDAILDTRRHPSGILMINPREFPINNKEVTEKRLLLEVLRYQTIAGFQDDAFMMYKNYAFITDCPNNSGAWRRFALVHIIYITLVEQGYVDTVIERVKNDRELLDSAVPSMLIADALIKEGRVEEMFSLLDLPQFQGPHAVGGIMFTSLVYICPETVEQMTKRFPEMRADQVLRAQEIHKLIEEDKWDEAMELIKTLDKTGGDDSAFPSSQEHLLPRIAWAEWMKGNVDRVNEVLSIIQTEEMKTQIALLREELDEVLKIECLEERRRALVQIQMFRRGPSFFSLLDFDGHHKMMMALLDIAGKIEDDPSVRIREISHALMDVGTQNMDAARGNAILEQGWKMMLEVDGVSHLDRIDAMLHNNRTRRAVLKIADFAVQAESLADQAGALLQIARRIAQIEMDYKPMTRDMHHY